MVDTLGHGYGRGGQAGESLQGVQLQALELPRGQRIEGDQAPWALIDHQRAAHAVVNFERGRDGGHQAIIGVGQLGIAGEAGGLGAAEQDLESRVFAHPEPPAEGIGAQPVHGQRYQPFAVQAQQRGGIAWQQAAHGLQQAAVALLVGQFAGQVTDQWQQRGEQRLCSHMDSSRSL